MDNLEKARKNILKKSKPAKGTAVRGYDFSKTFSIEEFLEKYGTTGFQATNLKTAVDIIKQMRQEKATIFLGYTSNMVSSGLREVIAYLVKNRYVDVLVTTAGGVEEDVIKTLRPFVLGSFRMDDRKLREAGINRIGNILVPTECYIEFEKLMMPFFSELHKEQKKTGKIISASEFSRRLGMLAKDENSVLYWAARNSIPVFCPALTDGSIGDMMYFFMHEHPDFKVDIAADLKLLTDIAMDSKKTGAIILGGSLPKHHIMNANLARGGTDYTVYITTGTEGDGSVSGARTEEAVSWGKQAFAASSVNVEGDATIIFPLIVAGAFGKK
ncbi:MAG: deoxyhypusine synthase [Candidatus Aenigmarchaeota archaeon]|nr:deoxyhypusine synthase [Candidatus Aenigmarchaeota archaeon]